MEPAAIRRLTIVVNINRAAHRPIIEQAKAEGRFVLIDRSTIWGNPYTDRPFGTRAQFVVATRQEAIERYPAYVLANPDLVAKLASLRGCVLACHCVPKLCHGVALARLADGHT